MRYLFPVVLLLAVTVSSKNYFDVIFCLTGHGISLALPDRAMLQHVPNI